MKKTFFLEKIERRAKFEINTPGVFLTCFKNCKIKKIRKKYTFITKK